MHPREAALLPSGSSNPRVVRSTKLICFGLFVAYTIFLATSFVQGLWLIDRQGLGIPTDFVNVWAAGRLVLDGDPAAAYDWMVHKEVEETAVGHRFERYFGWHYPPPFLFVAALLALLPYVPALLAWMLLTLPAYAMMLRKIVGHRFGLFFALSFPAVLFNLATGQNGFLTAALLGGTLGFLERSPLLAGCFLGLLTFKPHLGLLFPLVLAAGGRWRALFAAASVGATLAAASWCAFGTETWEAFAHSLRMATQLVLVDGLGNWNKLQSVFGLTRLLGGSQGLAWSLQALMAAMSAIGLWAMWRAPLPFELKAAALATGALLATPYLYVYDLVALAVPMAFLMRLGLAHGILPYEKIGFAGVGVLLLSFTHVVLPTGLAGLLIVAMIIARRVVGAAPSSSEVSAVLRPDVGAVGVR